MSTNERWHVTMVVDRSGSMHQIRDDAQGAINKFVEEQKQVEGKMTFSLVQFDTVYDIVVDGKPIARVPAYELEPRGSTALLDAVGKAIAYTATLVAGKKTKPDRVLIAIITDGHENSSVEYSNDDVAKAVKAKTDDGWEFVFLGADQSAWDVARDLHIRQASGYVPDQVGTQAAYGGLSTSLAASRASGQSFTYAGGDKRMAPRQTPPQRPTKPRVRKTSGKPTGTDR